MLRETKPKKDTVLADMSQYSIESGRLNSEQQLEKVQKERQLLVDRKLEIVRLLTRKPDNYDKIRRSTAVKGGRQHTRKVLAVMRNFPGREDLVNESLDIELRLQEINPILKQLAQEKHLRENGRQQIDALEDILAVLKQIAKSVSK